MKVEQVKSHAIGELRAT